MHTVVPVGLLKLFLQCCMGLVLSSNAYWLGRILLSRMQRDKLIWCCVEVTIHLCNDQ